MRNSEPRPSVRPGRSPTYRPRPAVFVDRDGTINENPQVGDYVRRPEDLKVLPGAAEALRRLKDAGYLLIAFTNQSAVSRGIMAPGEVDAVNARLGEILSAHGAPFDGVYYCPHWRGDGCACRKPAPGMLLRAAEDIGIDLARSWGIGDAARDLEAARAAGCRVVLVHANSYPGEREKGEALSPDASVPDLAAAAEFILHVGSSG